MRRKTMSIIGRIIGLILVVALAFGITWCATHWGTVQAEWDKIFNKTPQQEQPENPTPDNPDNPPQEEINLDGFYYIDVDGDITLVQIKENAYRTIKGYMTDSNIYFVDGWETKTEFETFNTTEDEKYIHVYYLDESNGYNYKIAIYDKATSTLYYDFSDGEQLPGGTYEDQLLFEMRKFTNYIVCNEHEWVEDLSYAPAPPTCGEYWNKQFECSKCHETKIEQMGPLEHDYVDGVCSRCGEIEQTTV